MMKNQKSRRKFVKNTVQLGIGLSLLGSSLNACNIKEKHKKTTTKDNKNLDILILGGTSFLGPHQIKYALERGHKVTTFTRGKTKPNIYPEIFDKVEQLIGDRANNLSALENRKWDVVIDNSGRNANWTKNSAELLKNNVGLYIYTSSTGVYFPYLGEAMDEDTKVLMQEPKNIEDKDLKLEYWYGVMKANSEAEAIKVFGMERVTIIRPTYMIGPADKSDRFIYWPVRLSRGGEIMVPGKTEDPVQYIDVRDVAEWAIRLAEENVTGTFNAVGPKNGQTMMEFVQKAKSTFDIESTLVQIDDYEFLKKNNIVTIVPWIMPVTYNYGSARINNHKALQAGLTLRTAENSVKDTYKWWTSLSKDRRNKFEQKPNSILWREKALLKNWKNRG